MTKLADQIIELRASLNANIAQRVAYEESKSAHSAVSKVIKYTSADHKTLETKLSDEFFKALIKAKALTSFDFINSHVRDNQRFNVYAIEKAFAKLHAIAANKLIKETALANKFCVACVLTCLQNRDKEQFTFTRDHALAMLSKALRFEHVAISDLATKFNVTQSTASTQVSSSFRALEALDILRFDDTARDRSVVSAVNYESAFVKLVQERFAIA